MTWGTVWACEKEELSSLFRKQLLRREVHPKWEISLNPFAGNYWQNHQHPLWVLMLFATCATAWLPCEEMTRGCWFRELFPESAEGKKRSADQIVSLVDLPACYFKDPVMKRKMKFGVYKQNERGRTKKVPMDFLNIKYNTGNNICRWSQQFASKF